MIEDTPMQSSFLAVVSGTGIAAACKPGDRCAKFSGSQKPYTTVDPVVEKVYGLVISIRLNFPVLRTTCITWSRLREFKSWQCQHTFHWRWWMKKCAKLQSFSSELSMPHHPANWWCLGRMLWLFEQAASNESQSIFVALLEDLEGELICCSFFFPFSSRRTPRICHHLKRASDSHSTEGSFRQRQGEICQSTLGRYLSAIYESSFCLNAK